MYTLDDFHDIVGDRVLSDIYKVARSLYGLKVLQINSTYYGGGVAEMLYTLVPLMNDVGINADWRILRGTPDFFGITKEFHNAIQGDPIELTDMKKQLYQETNEDFASYCKIEADLVHVHDPQPLPLIQFYKKSQPWMWRCHVDLSHPNQPLWRFLKRFILRYNVAIVSHELYRKEDLPVDQRVIQPVIDPLSLKNKDLSPDQVHETLKKFNVPDDKPFITQISRFDKWKDPLGVIEIFKLVRKQLDCRLVLCGSMASDDPEGLTIFNQVQESAKELIAGGDVILLTVENNMLVNALQRAAAVIIQKSIREGFGLTVTEGLWKGKPVIASNVGGIPLQIRDGETGYLVEPTDFQGCADRIAKIFRDPAAAEEMGKKAKEDVRSKFLITRMLLDELKLVGELVG
jgi:trehalose synthase